MLPAASADLEHCRMRIPCVSKPLQQLSNSARNGVWEQVDICIVAANTEDPHAPPESKVAPSAAYGLGLLK